MPTKNSPVFALLLGAGLALSGCNYDSISSIASKVANSPATAASAPDYWPTGDWQTAAPESHGFSAGAFDTLATDAATALPYYTSLLVIKDGWIVHESYHDTPSETGNTVDTLHHVWSITKSVTSMTLGRARTLGDLNSPDALATPDVLDVSAEKIFPASVIATLPDGDLRRKISLRDALQMRSGLAWNETSWLLQNPAKDPLLAMLYGLDHGSCPADGDLLLCFIINRPLAYAPGTVWNYDTYDSYLVSAFFTGITGQPLATYAATNLFSPLGITFNPANWTTLGGNYTFGGGLLLIRSRDLAKLGMLMLYDGKWEDTQLISKDWIDLSIAPQGAGQLAAFDAGGEPAASVAGDIRYGMQWWRKTGPGMDGLDSISARGLGGQQMHVFRDKGLIVLITCDSDDVAGPRSAAINTFMQNRILSRLNP